MTANLTKVNVILKNISTKFTKIKALLSCCHYIIILFIYVKWILKDWGESTTYWSCHFWQFCFSHLVIDYFWYGSNLSNNIIFINLHDRKMFLVRVRFKLQKKYNFKYLFVLLIYLVKNPRCHFHHQPVWLAAKAQVLVFCRILSSSRV